MAVTHYHDITLITLYWCLPAHVDKMAYKQPHCSVGGSVISLTCLWPAAPCITVPLEAVPQHNDVVQQPKALVVGDERLVEKVLYKKMSREKCEMVVISQCQIAH